MMPTFEIDDSVIHVRTTEDRLSGPDYAGEWDGAGMSQERICRYCDLVTVN